MGRGRQSEIVELSWAQPVTGTAGGWQDLGGTTPGVQWGRAGLKPTPGEPHGACSKGGDRQREGASPPVCSAARASEARSAPTWGMVRCEEQILLHPGPAGE